MNKQGFDPEQYLEEQTAAILERVARFDSKLYLEFGGKLIADFHAARVLPGFDPNAKIKLLQQLKDQVEIIICIYSGDIERRKTRADFGVTYDSDALRLMDDLQDWGIGVSAVVLTRFQDTQQSATAFKNKLERRGVRIFTHGVMSGFPADIDLVVGERGFGANAYVETAKPLVAVIGPGPGSGKMSTCLSQLYHDHKRGIKSGYAKFETFPIWNLPLRHPVNAAYEAATADIMDFNLIDPFHLEAYQVAAVNYNRDVESFPLLSRILQRIVGGDAYRSPTDMGVNRAGFAIIDDAAVRRASEQEIIRRHFRYGCEYIMGLASKQSTEKVSRLMEELGLKPGDRRVVAPARRAAEDAKAGGKGHRGICCGAALELPDGTIVTGKNSPLLHAASSVILNAAKTLAEIPDKLHLLPPSITQSIAAMKQNLYRNKNTSLDAEELLIALSISAISNPAAQMALESLKELHGCEAHTTHIPTSGDATGMRRLGINLTSDAQYPTKDFYIA